MTLSDQQFEFIKDVSALIDFIANVKGYKVTAKHLMRSQEEQQRLYDDGLSQTLESNHLYSCAIDLVIFKDGKTPCWDWEELKEIGQFWENLNKLNRWGGFWKSFRDVPHFERNVK